MDDLEQKLQSMRLASPPASLDRRIEETFAAAWRNAAEREAPGLLWWLTRVAAGAGVAALIFVAILRPIPPAAPAVYQVEAEGRLRDMLRNTVAEHDGPPAPFAIHVNGS